MKSYINAAFALLFSATVLVSCDSQLDQTNPNQATEDTFWKDEKDFNLALTSCYTPLKNALDRKSVV